MRRGFIPPPDLTELDHKRAVRLKNVTCPYCGCDLSENSFTEDHVIGRRFVPKGALNVSVNLIVRACRACNEAKSDLEDDLSALTMQPDVFGEYPVSDPHFIAEAQRKASGSLSRRTGKRVLESAEHVSYAAGHGTPVQLTASFVAPPQPDEQRAFRLARFHLSAFFYWVTYRVADARGGFWPGDYMLLNAAMKRDWGNALQRAYAAAVVEWEPRVLLRSPTNPYFAAVIRRHPKAECWSWALEWNCSYRLTGFLGDRAAAQAIVDALPPLKRHLLHQDEKRTLLIRTDVPLSDQDDVMFALAVEDNENGAT